MSDAKEFKLGMRRLAGGVSVITTFSSEGPTGLIATAVSSLSAAPPSLIVCVGRESRSHDSFLASVEFAVNVLAYDDIDLARRFSAPEFRRERFSDSRWQVEGQCAPILTTALAVFKCRLATTFSHASHSIFVGEVVDTVIAQVPVDPLIYLDGGFVGCTSIDDPTKYTDKSERIAQACVSAGTT